MPLNDEVFSYIKQFPGVSLAHLFRIMREEHKILKKSQINFAVARLLQAGRLEREHGWGSCGGYGHFIKKAGYVRCSECSGRGFLVIDADDPLAYGLPSESRACEMCHGNSYIREEVA